MTGSAIIEAEAVGFAYGRDLPEVLRGVDLVVRRGEFIALLGQNGAGKTTLAKTFNGLNVPTRGKVMVGGRPIAGQRLADVAKIVGYCYQNPDHQIFSASVEKEVGFGPSHLGYPPADVAGLVDRALALVGLTDLRTAHPFSLGRGQRQLLAVASVLAMNPPVLVIDEPTTGMDRIGAAQIMKLLTEWAQEGRTIVAITHDMDMVVEYIPRSIVLVDGLILADGPTQDVFRQKAVLNAAHLDAPASVVICDRLAEFGVDRARSIAEAAASIIAVNTGDAHASRL